jgi:hypothetical protein
LNKGLNQWLIMRLGCGVDGPPAAALIVSTALFAARAASAVLLLFVAAEQVLTQTPSQQTTLQHQQIRRRGALRVEVCRPQNSQHRISTKNIGREILELEGCFVWTR